MIPILFRIGQKSELSSDPPGGRLKLPSPTLSKKKEKEKKNKKYKKDQKRPQARLLQERCVHCHELFSQVLHWLPAGQWAGQGYNRTVVCQSEAGPGSCQYAPDLVKQGIECMSCLACAKCLLYHCHYEDENFTGQSQSSLTWRSWRLFDVSDDDICTCDNTDGHLGKRWLGLSLLAVLVPCLCLYPLLTACHGCGRACKMCGGRHQS